MTVITDNKLKRLTENGEVTAQYNANALFVCLSINIRSSFERHKRFIVKFWDIILERESSESWQISHKSCVQSTPKLTLKEFLYEAKSDDHGA